MEKKEYRWMWQRVKDKMRRKWGEKREKYTHKKRKETEINQKEKGNGENTAKDRRKKITLFIEYTSQMVILNVAKEKKRECRPTKWGIIC